MKIVRKFLRLMPIIILLFAFLYFTIASNQSYSSIYELDGYSPFDNFWDKYDAFYMNYGGMLFDFLGIGGVINTFCVGTLNISASNMFSVDLVISLLVYELFLSFIFLIFDVFNFMISIASNWLRKGESLNE